MPRRGSLTVLVGLALWSCPPAHGQAGSPTQPECAPLATGSTGLIQVGQYIPASGAATGAPGGFGPVATIPLPDAIGLRTATQTFSAEYGFVLRKGTIYVRRAKLGRGLPGERWHVLDLPPCLAGHVTAISADGRLLLALGQDRQIYSNDMPGGDLSANRWTWRWGPYFWSGSGLRLWPDVTDWATSDFGGDVWFTDSSGVERHPIGVATVYLLRGDHRRITLLDPWLPNDESREACGPRRGTVPLAGLSGSASTVFVVTKAGELWTRIYDFDVSGANTVFGHYSWETGRPASDMRWQLPGPRWLRHARPPGPITDRIAIATSGTHSKDRLLRVAGRDGRGHSGYWEKPIAARGRGAWRFVTAPGETLGHRLPLSGAARRFAADDRRFLGKVNGRTVSVRDFNPECSPAHLRVQVAPRVRLDLILHTSDGLRQETRAHGLDDTPREYNGAIEVPLRTWKKLAAKDPRRRWIADNLGGQRITVAPVAVTTTRLRFLRQCWELTLGGKPARDDVPRTPPDLGMTVGRETEQQQDGWSPSC